MIQSNPIAARTAINNTIPEPDSAGAMVKLGRAAHAQKGVLGPSVQRQAPLVQSVPPTGAQSAASEQVAMFSSVKQPSSAELGVLRPARRTHITATTAANLGPCDISATLLSVSPPCNMVADDDGNDLCCQSACCSGGSNVRSQGVASATDLRTWRVTAAPLRTCVLAGLLLAAAFGVAEVTARLPAVRQALLAPSVGSASRRFELQLETLDRYVDSTGGIDCLALGNSATLMGVDPEALGRGYRINGVHGPRCFNFGIGGLSASAAGELAPVLIDLYRPALVVYVVSARDVAQDVRGPVLAETPWLAYRRGVFSVDGWLVDHSAALRYFLLYRQWLDPVRWRAASAAPGTTNAGFFATRGGRQSPALWQRTRRQLSDLAGRSPAAAELEGFANVLASGGETAQIVVVEAPLHPKVRAWLGQHADSYDEILAQLREIARRRGVAFWPAPDDAIIPADGWLDFVHLNARGAASFSEWLGDEIATAAGAGELAPPDAPRHRD